MNRRGLFGAPAALLAAMSLLAACEEPTVRLTHQITVSGAPDDVNRFLALQQGRPPALGATSPKPLRTGVVEATLTLSREVEGEDVVRLTREAQAAGLSYQYLEGASRVTRS